MNTLCQRFIGHCASRLPRARLVIELGSFDVNGNPRGHFAGARYIGVDLRDGRGVDVVCDAAEYVPAEPADVVVCTSLLEHCPYPRDVIRNAYNMLRDGGVLILCTPTGRYPAHGVDGNAVGNEHYCNPTRGELEGWLSCYRRWAVTERESQLLVLAVR